MQAVLSTSEQNMNPLTTISAGVLSSESDVCNTVALTDEKKTAVVSKLSEVADAPSEVALTIGSPRTMYNLDKRSMYEKRARACRYPFYDHVSHFFEVWCHGCHGFVQIAVDVVIANMCACSFSQLCSL